MLWTYMRHPARERRYCLESVAREERPNECDVVTRRYQERYTITSCAQGFVNGQQVNSTSLKVDPWQHRGRP